MRVERVSLAVAFVCAAVPALRYQAISQLGQADYRELRSIWQGNVDTAVRGPSAKSDAEVLRKHPNDFLLRLGIAQCKLSGRPETEASRIAEAERLIRDLRRDCPKEGAVFVVALGLPRYEVIVPRRAESDGIIPQDATCSSKPAPPTAKQLDGCRRCVDLLGEAIKADPGNGWFHAQKAHYLYGLHRDDEARREIHFAAVAPRFTDYSNLRARAIDRVVDLRAELDPQYRVAKKVFAQSPMMSHIRDAVPITSRLAYDDMRGGRVEEGLNAVSDLTNSSYNMMVHADTILSALTGSANLQIGAQALDPGFQPSTKDPEARYAALIARYTKILTEKGRQREAAVLAKQWQQSRRLPSEMRRYTRTDSEQAYQALASQWTTYTTSSWGLGLAILFALIWLGTALLTVKVRRDDLWDKRAAITALLICVLALSPVITNLFVPTADRMYEALSLAIMDEPSGSRLNPTLLLIPLGIAGMALGLGLVMMLRRPREQGMCRSMPLPLLLVAFVGSLAAAVYFAYGLGEFAIVSERFALIQAEQPWGMMRWSVLGLGLHALLRAAQLRLGPAKRKLLPTALVTLRISSVVAVALCAVMYLGLIALTASAAAKADVAAKDCVVCEAGIVSKALR